MKKKASLSPKILVVGDLIVDVYRHGTSIGRSSEAPVLVMREDKVDFSAGGAGFVVENLLALGASVKFVTVLGDDENFGMLKDIVNKNLQTFFVEEKGRMNTVKQRFLTGEEKIFRWDRIERNPISKESQKKIFAVLKREIAKVDKVLVMDARHGVMTLSLAKALVKECRRQNKLLYVDSQVSRSTANHVWYRGATLVCLNQKEANSVDSSFSELALEASVKKIAKHLGINNIVIKRGKNGSAALIGREYLVGKPYKVDAKDAVGAGDAFLSALAMSGFPHTVEDLRKANIWAALSTTIVGTRPPNKKMFLEILKKDEPVRNRRK